MTDTMVERVAAAIMQAARDWASSLPEHAKLTPADCPSEIMARAAMKAMIWPTEKMIKSGLFFARCFLDPEEDEVDPDALLWGFWEDMINGALAEDIA
jgi:hypothetical protein